MNIIKDLFLRGGIYIAFALFLGIFSYYMFFKPDSEDVILVPGKEGAYYVKFIEYNSKSDIQIRIHKLLDEASNRQVLVSEGKYKLNDDCSDELNSTEQLMNYFDYYREDKNVLEAQSKKCYLEKTLE